MLWDLKVTDPEACRFVLGCGDYHNNVYNWKFDLDTEALPRNDNVNSVRKTSLLMPRLLSHFVVANYAYG